MSKPFSVIIPAYNEERAIGDVIQRVRQLYPHVEIVVVDDGSTDGTASQAEQAGAVTVRQPANMGYGRSLMDGIRCASHDHIVITDADGSYPIERIADLVAKLDQGFDMAVGARQGKEYRGSFFKVPARWVLKWLVEFTTGRKIPDINSGLRAFRKSQAMPIFPDLCQGFSFTTTITLIYMLTGKIVCYLPVDYFKRVGRSKVRMLRDSLRTFQYVTEVIAVYNPLKLFVLLAAILGVLSVGSLIIAYFLDCQSLWMFGSATFSSPFIVFGMGLLAYRVGYTRRNVDR